MRFSSWQVWVYWKGGFEFCLSWNEINTRGFPRIDVVRYFFGGIFTFCWCPSLGSNVFSSWFAISLASSSLLILIERFWITRLLSLFVDLYREIIVSKLLKIFLYRFLPDAFYFAFWVLRSTVLLAGSPLWCQVRLIFLLWAVHFLITLVQLQESLLWTGPNGNPLQVQS